MLSPKRELERETGLEPATLSLEGFGLEGRSVYALWHPSWRGERSVSSYRVVLLACVDHS